jgi:hypothetical protein
MNQKISLLNEKLLMFYNFNKKIDKKIKKKEIQTQKEIPEVYQEIQMEVEKWKLLNEKEYFSVEFFKTWDVLNTTEKYNLWRTRPTNSKTQTKQELEIIEMKRNQSIHVLTFNLLSIVDFSFL